MDKKYSIGDYVIVSKTMFRDKQGPTVKWRQRLPYVSTKPRLGQVVGLCTRYDGHVEPVGFRDGYYDDPPYFVPKKTHFFWLVRFGLMNKAVEVGEEDMRLASIEEVEELPLRFPKWTMSEQDKQCLREDSYNWPRDEKGRWIAEPISHH